MIRTDPKEAWRTIGVAKFTDTGKALKAWCLEMHETYVISKKEGEDTSFSFRSTDRKIQPKTLKMITYEPLYSSNYRD